MKLQFAHKEGSGLPVSDSYGYQEVVASLLDDNNQIIVILDKKQGKYYIEQVINRFAIDLFAGINFKKIEDPEEWDEYLDFFYIMGIIPK